MDKYSHIELFAGCGGMGLGLEAAGFDLFFANELSPMASETFAYNLLQEKLEQLSNENKTASKTLWIKSAYPKEQLKSRLRENPFEAKNGKFSDLEATTDLEKKLLVGDIDQLLEWFIDNPKIASQVKRKGITLLSGGPPCQSFSLAGKREKNNAKNLLPLSFAKLAGLLRPKFVLLENVRGITAPFTEDGKKHYAWFEVAKALALEGYVPICMLLNSKYFGVAQNRPRFILLAIEKSIAFKLSSAHTEEYLHQAVKFYKTVKKHKDNVDSIDMSLLNYYDIENNKALYNGFIFPKITTSDDEFIPVSEAIGDLKKSDAKPSSKLKFAYRDELKTIFKNPLPPNGAIFYNHEIRHHSDEVKRRFRLYQVINQFKNGNKKNAVDYIVGKVLDERAKEKLIEEFSNYELYIQDTAGNSYFGKLTNQLEIENYLDSTNATEVK